MQRFGQTPAMERHGDDALRELIRQSQMSGARRRAVVLHTDRLPPPLARPHHVQLARQALQELATADRARSFELSRGRFAIVWRGSGDAALALARTALGHLLSGQPKGQSPALGELLTLYDLPEQAAWLHEVLCDRQEPSGQPVLGSTPLDTRLLARLEAGLSQADLARFIHWRPVMALPGNGMPPAWEERVFALDELAAAVCPGRELRSDPWLFRRLTRTLDQRMLTMLAMPRELRGRGPFAVNLNVASLLSPEFLGFDQALPSALRGQVILNLRAADMLSDPATFTFARNFAVARSYRLALAGATPAMLNVLDTGSAGISIVKLAWEAASVRGLNEVTALLPRTSLIVLTGLNSESAVQSAMREGFSLGQGRAVSL